MGRFPAPLLAAALGACAAGGGAPPDEAARAEVASAVRGMYAAFQKRDLAAVGAYMTAESTCYDARRSALLRGRQAVLDHFGLILSEHPADRPWEAAIEEMEVTLSGDLAWAVYRVKTSAGGMHALAAVTHLFRRSGGRWLAVHLHRSWNVLRD
jgi:ketosteroid isomerase-like protein